MLRPSPDLVAHGMQPVEVSVIIPSYNYGRFIDECLDSVYRQRGVSFEIVLVDDGSTDDTVARLAPHRERVTYLYQDNQGPSAARNAGARASRGRYLQFLDTDDLLGENSLAARVAVLRALDPRSLVVCRNNYFSRLSAAGSPFTRGQWHLFRNDLVVHLLRLNIAPLHAFLLPRTAFDEAGGYDESDRGAEDYDFWLRVCGAGFVPHFSAAGRVFYRQHDASVTVNKAHKRDYRFDVVVHRRKHLNQYGAAVAAALATPEGAIALCDGTLSTAIAIDAEVNAAGIVELASIAKAHLGRFLHLTEGGHGQLLPTARLYLTRLALRRRDCVRFADGELLEMLDAAMAAHCGWRDCWRNLHMAFPFADYDRLALSAATMKRLQNLLRE